MAVLLLAAGSPVRAAPASDIAGKLDEPYTIDGTQYRPADGPSDEVGYAGFMANGIGVSATHKTLPVPSYVEVTSLATGRTILVRIAERGPATNYRLADLSCGAARQLGLPDGASAAVRIRRVSPPEQERTALRAGDMAAERLPTPAPLLTVLRGKLPPLPAGPGTDARCGVKPPVPSSPAVTAASPKSPPAAEGSPVELLPDASPPASKPVKAASATQPVRPGANFVIEADDGSRPLPPPQPHAATPAGPRARTGDFLVQIAATATRARADTLARAIGGYVEPAGPLFRVRKGPYDNAAAARTEAQALHAKGFADARVITNEGR